MDEPPSSEEAPPIGTVLHGSYELLRFLGAGAMGAVYEAQTLENQRVAVKVLLRTAMRLGGAELLKRFKREALVAASLDNPHVVPVIDAGVDEDTRLPFMVMPLLLGLDLGQLLARVGPLHPVVGVRIVRQLCVGLAAAHGAGVIHRDIKPANLFLAHGPSGQVTVRVLDFGIAKWKADDAQLTHTTCLLGTPHYCAPEQLQSSKHVDVRADLWSVGATLYQILSGTVPHPIVGGLVQIISAAVSSDPKHIQDHAPWLDPALASVVHGVLQRDRDKRCPSVEALAEALDPFAAGEDHVTVGMLAPLADEIREIRLSRGRLPGHWDEVAAPLPSSALLPVSEEPPDPHLGRRFADRFEVLRLISRGAMGAVYEAQDDGGTRYAVKVIREEVAAQKEALRRFVREARAITAIESDHVVRLVEAGAEQDKTPFLVMELLQGFDLARVLRHHSALAPYVAARLFGQACRGIQAAHDQGIVHRDIKPANLFLHELPDGQVVVKVCDFGVAKQLAGYDGAAATAVLTRTGGFLGSPMYMSPEQARNARDIDARTDIWSIGATMFEAITGTRPWLGHEGVGEVIVAICTEPVARVKDRAPWVPAELAAVVERAMVHEPADRYATVGEMADALERLADGSLTLQAEEIVGLTEAQRRERARPAVMVDGPVSETAATRPDRPPAAAAGSKDGTMQSDDGLASPAATALAASYDELPVKSRWPLVATLAGLGGAAVVATVMLVGSDGDPQPSGSAASSVEAVAASAEGTAAGPSFAPTQTSTEHEASASAPAPSPASAASRIAAPGPPATTTPPAPLPATAVPTATPTAAATATAAPTTTSKPGSVPAPVDTFRL